MTAMRALVQPGWNALLLRCVRLAAAQDQRLQGQFEDFLQLSRKAYEQFRAMGAQGEAWSAGMGLVWAEHDQGHHDRALAIGAALVDDIRATGLLLTYLQLRGQPLAPESESEPDTDRTDPLGLPVVLPQTLAALDSAIVRAPKVVHRNCRPPAAPLCRSNRACRPAPATRHRSSWWQCCRPWPLAKPRWTRHWTWPPPTRLAC